MVILGGVVFFIAAKNRKTLSNIHDNFQILHRRIKIDVLDFLVRRQKKTN